MKNNRNVARDLHVNYAMLARRVIGALVASRFDLEKTVEQVRASIWGDDLTEEQKREMLFGPRHPNESPRGWDELPMAVLDARYLTLPDALLPISEENLEAHCRWLLSRGGDGALAETFVRGWAGQGATPLEAFSRFIRELWAVESHSPAFFEAVVCGNHAVALALIADRHVSDQLSDAAAIAILGRMALIWAAFDCQATTARVRRSMTKPFGWFVAGDADRMSVATLVSAFLPFYDTLKTTLAAYRSAPEAAENKPKLRSRKPQVDDIRRYTSAEVEEIQHVRGQFAFDGAMTEIQGIVRESTAPFFALLVHKEAHGKIDRRQMSQVWYAGLLPLSIVGLVAIRVAQMEQTLEGILKESVSAAREQRRTPVILVPDFCAAHLASGWKTRAREIADALRGSVLKDPDYHSLRIARAGASDDRGAMFDFPAHDDTFIEPVIAFFNDVSRNGPAATHDGWSEKRGTYEFLDLAIERRFRNRSVE